MRWWFVKYGVLGGLGRLTRALVNPQTDLMFAITLVPFILLLIYFMYSDIRYYLAKRKLKEANSGNQYTE